MIIFNKNKYLYLFSGEFHDALLLLSGDSFGPWSPLWLRGVLSPEGDRPVDVSGQSRASVKWTTTNNQKPARCAGGHDNEYGSLAGGGFGGRG